MDDDALLAATRRDPEAFGAFYRRHERAVFAYFRCRVRESDLAADLTAETFAAALLASRRYRADGRPAVAVRARVIDEDAYPDIAERLRCSEQVVRKRVSRGLARLRSAEGDA
jgi:DNA-directed RNA polymerase specialized sigma24 family protein